MRSRVQKVLQAGCCLACVLVALRYSSGLDDSEFSGGRITGPILDLFDGGTLLLALAGILSFFLHRVAAAAALIATLLCLPLYIYFTAPGPFRAVFHGEYSVPYPSYFVWNWPNTAAIAA